MNQSQLQPVLFGALFIGVLSGLPIINVGNCCCLWIVGGGMLTAWLQQREGVGLGHQGQRSLGEGALGGFLAGIAGAVVYVVVYIPISFVTAPLQRVMMEWMVDSGAEIPPEVLDMFDDFGAEGILAGAVFGFFAMLFAGMIFSTLGGLFGVLLFRPSPPAPPLPPAMPPPPASSMPPPPPPPVTGV